MCGRRLDPVRSQRDEASLWQWQKVGWGIFI